MLALLRDEPAAPLIDRAVREGGAVMSWINLGEVFYIEARIVGEGAAAAVVEQVRRAVSVEGVDSTLVIGAARLKARHPLSYADAFAVVLANRLSLPLMTGDPEILALDGEARVIDLRGR